MLREMKNLATKNHFFILAVFALAIFLVGCKPQVPAASTNQPNANTANTNAANTNVNQAANVNTNVNTNRPTENVAVAISVRNSSALGDFLVGANQMTLYTFKNDSPNLSNCAGQCAVVWPPLIGTVTVQGGVNGTIGSVTRADGTKQVTYNELPLYYYINDKVSGDTNGEGFNNLWSVVKP